MTMIPSPTNPGVDSTLAPLYGGALLPKYISKQPNEYEKLERHVHAAIIFVNDPTSFIFLVLTIN